MSESSDFAAAARAMTRAMVAMTSDLRAFGAQMIEAAGQLDQALWEAYEQAGHPYGPNHAGRDRWLQDMAEIGRLQDRIDEIRTEHAMLAELRRIVHGRELG